MFDIIGPIVAIAAVGYVVYKIFVYKESARIVAENSAKEVETTLQKVEQEVIDEAKKVVEKVKTAEKKAAARVKAAEQKVEEKVKTAVKRKTKNNG